MIASFRSPAEAAPQRMGALAKLPLFFDFAGYSAFAVGISRLFGIKTPENFDAPFLSRNIKECWTRWHISLAFWFRDHVYMRFQIAAAKGKWFAGKRPSMCSAYSRPSLAERDRDTHDSENPMPLASSLTGFASLVSQGSTLLNVVVDDLLLVFRELE